MFIKRTSIGGDLFVEMRLSEAGYRVQRRQIAPDKNEMPWEIRSDGTRAVKTVYAGTREGAERLYREELQYPAGGTLRLRE